MSRKPENTFIASIHKLLPESVYAMKNNNPYLGGLPDCWYSGHRGDLWVEYKFIVVPARDDTLIDLVNGRTPILSMLQQQWLARRNAEGRNVAVVVGCKHGGVFYRPTEWTKSYNFRDFRSRLMTRQDIADQIRDYVG